MTARHHGLLGPKPCNVILSPNVDYENKSFKILSEYPNAFRAYFDGYLPIIAVLQAASLAALECPLTLRNHFGTTWFRVLQGWEKVNSAQGLWDAIAYCVL